VSNPLPSSVYQGNAGVSLSTTTTVETFTSGIITTTTTVTLTTGLQANASVSAGGSGGIFGSVVSGTLLIFGNFFAALQYLANLAIGMLLPYQYVFSWLDWNPHDASVVSTATAIAGMVNALVWVAYANDFFYIISGRWLFPP